MGRLGRGGARERREGCPGKGVPTGADFATTRATWRSIWVWTLSSTSNKRRNRKGPLPMAAAPLFESPSSWGPQPSPTQWVGWGEEEQGSGGRDAHAWASRRERTLRRRGRRGAVPGYGRLLQSPVKRSAERPGAGAQRAAQTKKQLRRSVRIYREVKDKAGRNGLPCPFYTV